MDYLALFLVTLPDTALFAYAAYQWWKYKTTAKAEQAQDVPE